jgi:hypothetical protein
MNGLMKGRRMRKIWENDVIRENLSIKIIILIEFSGYE